MRLSTPLRQLAVLLPLLWSAECVQADEGIPALLQFAEQYRDTHSPGAQAKSSAAIASPTTATLSENSTLRLALKDRDVHLARQQATLRMQEKELGKLRQSLASEIARSQQAIKAAQSQVHATVTTKPADLAPLLKLVSGLRQAAKGMPDAQDQVKALKEQVNALKRQLQAVDAKKTNEQQMQQVLTAQQQALKKQLDEKTAALVQQQQQLVAANAVQDVLRIELKTLQADQKDQHTVLTARQEKEKTVLKRQLAAKEQQLTAIEKKAQEMQVVTEQKETTLSGLQLENQTLQLQQAALTRQVRQAEADLAKQAQTLHQVRTDADVLRTQAKWLAKPQTLNKPAGQQAYAAGGALGLNERKSWGVETDQQTLLAGVVDAFAGQYQLSTDVLTRALADSEAAVNEAREKVAAGQQKNGERFVEDFKKQKGVKLSPAGFWYRVDYAGDAPLRDTDIVDVVVKETLTDGTVIHDMSMKGNVLSQPLNAYPPLFREAIGHLKNHGTLTMVVPPTLAYGEAGYPPKVPPNATMVYELRIDSSKAAPGA
jgi:FKBP-type peptidyl-prolyl cis-trans isomerase